ncbi:uncharacterized protein LOC118171773 isoform X7 [Oxyura jamaicensis]|uniref:uncharacterized protein LOC118171773 isoform X7 n=1 Tax=Oxyura jamaicensis TaxID=8884 RepID=UPI0015A5C8DA|nr:uncharacterized protein LOC118171773 isoform X7 [Oxyura jamaicensis]
MVFPSHAIRSGNRLFGKQTEPQTDSEVTFLIALLCPQATFRRSSWCFNKWGTHNKAITISHPGYGNYIRKGIKSWQCDAQTQHLNIFVTGSSLSNLTLYS